MILEFGGVLDVVTKLWKFKQIATIGFGRKIQLRPQCVHPWAKGTGHTSKHKNANNLVHINYILTTNNNYRKLMICRKYVLDNEWKCNTVFH